MKVAAYIKHVSAETTADQVKANRLEATTDFARMDEVDAVIICVPTPYMSLRPGRDLKSPALEEIAWRHGWLDRSSIERQADRHGKSSYGAYLRRLVDDELSLGNL